MSRILAIAGLEADGYQRHAVHGESCLWVEKNCYVDVWIELIHALGLEPLAIMPFTVATDFEGDQWTFFKPPHDELRDLYGIDVQELNMWRPLLAHAEEFIAAGKLISTEADAFWLPDTSGTDYRRQHTKSTIILADLDVGNRRLGYFHNAGYFALEGEDFVNTFRVGFAPDPTFLPLFAESVRIDGLRRLPETELVERSLALWNRHSARIPRANPVERFAARVARELGAAGAMDLGTYHAWAFANIRQLGSAFELAAASLRWLADRGVQGLGEAMTAFDSISQANKTFILKGARAVNARRAFDGREMFAAMADDWARGTEALGRRFRA